MNRPTIADLAKAAGVSVSTVNRILGGRARAGRHDPARPGCGRRDRLLWPGRHRRTQEGVDAALPSRLPAPAVEPRALSAVRTEDPGGRAAWRDAEIEAVIEFVDQLEPENIAARLKALGEDCDAVAVIAADHPLIGQAIQALKAEGKPVVAYITDQSAPDRAGYVGTDNWKLGRTAAWFIAQTTSSPDGSQSSSAITGISARTYRTRASARTCARTPATSPSRTAARRTRSPRRPTGSSPSCSRSGRPGRHLHRRRRDLGRSAGPAGSARGAAAQHPPRLSGHRP